MNDLLRRRRAMMNRDIVWDYEWNYTDGLLSENGWEKSITGTANESMANDGMLLSSNKPDSSSLQNYIRCSNSNYNMRSGIMEVVFTPLSYDNGKDGSQNNRIALSNGTNGICIFYSNGYWKFLTGGPSTSENLWRFGGVNREYRIRIKMIDGIGSVRINDSLVASNLDVNDYLYTGVTAVWSQNQGGSSLFKSIKIKRL